jgi:iron complex outermembrane receptor protein
VVAAPSLVGIPGLSDLKRTAGNLYSSAAFSDTLAVLNDGVLLTLGGRYQRIESQSYNGISGLRTASYDRDTVTPAVGAIVKVRDNVALYANYVEGLQQGPTAPVTAVNFGQIFAPTVARQVETGVKVDWGRWTSTLGVFEITQANGITDPSSGIYAVDGQQRNRGLEFNVFGEPLAGFRLLGGFALIDGIQVRTAGATLDGNTAIGVPAYNINIGAELDVPHFSNLTLSGRAIHTASQFVNAANTQSIPAWTRFDLGARYVVAGWNGKPLTLRFNVENVLDTNYYASASTGQVTGISRGAPRTFIWSATASF